jgi:aspartate racemase
MLGDEKAQSTAMKTLGIIGGVGPESTIDYYRSIIALYRQRKDDGSYPEIIINSIDLKKEIDLVERNQLGALSSYLLEEVEKLARAGADFGLIASNTPHIVFDDLRLHSPVPLISIVEATCEAAKEMDLKRVGLFGTTFTMQGKFYRDVFARVGIVLVVPALEDQTYVHDKYMNELVNGVFLPETHDGLLEVVDRLRETQQIQGLILGGTELPLILKEERHNGLPILNTTKIHVAAAVREMLA